MSSVQPAAEKGFGAAADAYERGRPSYPPSVVEHLAACLPLTEDTEALDLGAGTGKMTRLLAPLVGRLIALEPVAAMREQLRAVLPGAEVLDAPAEAIPLATGTIDAVVVAQAFHWFDQSVALAEIARVLRSGGGLALVWNVRDESVPWVAQLSEMIHWHRHEVSAYESRIDWAAVVASAGEFTPLQKVELFHQHEHDAETLIDRVASTSYIAAMRPADRSKVIERVKGLIADFPEQFPMPYRTDVYWTHRL